MTIPPDETPAIPNSTEVDEPPRPPLTDAARRALAEAEERRRAGGASGGAGAAGPAEVGGRDGPDPVRYGD